MQVWWRVLAFLGLIAGVVALSTVLRRPAVTIALAPVSVTLPADDAGASFASVSGAGSAEIVEANCLACHSADFVMGQPALTAAEWAAEVTKMRKVYKAPIAEADDAAIVAWLTAMSARTARLHAMAAAKTDG